MEEVFRQERKKQRAQAKAEDATRLKQEKREEKKRRQKENAQNAQDAQKKQTRQNQQVPQFPQFNHEPFTYIVALRCLELPIQATEDQIRKAYRRLALQYHPDKNPSKDTTSQFRRMKEAYEFLQGT